MTDYIPDPLALSLNTLIEVSTLLGFPLEDRSRIRNKQDPAVWETCQKTSTVVVPDPQQAKRFYYGSLDFLVEDTPQGKRFHPIELNGTGMNGITNISLDAVRQIMGSLSQATNDLFEDPIPILLVPIPPLGRPIARLIYERLLCAQALKNGFKKTVGIGQMIPLEKIISEGSQLLTQPTIILGRPKEFIHYLQFDSADHRLHFLNHPIAGCLQDQLCDNLFSMTQRQLDFETFLPINGIFPLSTDKGTVYTYMKRLVRQESFPCLIEDIDFRHCYHREELIETIEEEIGRGNRVVIKPHAAALGRGIDFFIVSHTREQIVQKVDDSIEAVCRFQKAGGSVFPYTVCRFIDACGIPKKEHPLFGHRFELRIMVYREGMEFKAFPSIVKVSSKRYDPENPDRWMLLNNVTVSHAVMPESEVDFIMPLSNLETLEMIDVSLEQLQTLCRFSTELIKLAVGEPNPTALLGTIATTSTGEGERR